MANRGVGYFDSKGQYYRSPEEATMSDIAALLGRMGEGDSLAPGIAKIILDKRREIEHILADHDRMVQGLPVSQNDRRQNFLSDATREPAKSADNVTPLQRPSSHS
jgi:hypothetical protein